MNNWHDEYNAEYQRQRIINDMKLIRLEEEALSAREYRPGLFRRTMFNFANWMISTGKQLRRRYEVPVHNCNQAPTSNFAR